MSVVNGGLFDTITGFVGGLFYPLFSIIFALIDAVQNVFYSFAGIGDAAFGATLAGQYIGAGNSGGERDTGLLYFLLNNSLVKNMLISIAILGLFLMIIFTVMAFIKNIYSAKQKGWKEIIGLSIKGLANFVFLPVCVLLGVWLGNILLQAINGATSGTGGGTSMSRKLFIAAAYNSNEFRNNDENAIADPTVVEELKQWIQRLGGAQALFNVTTETDEEGKEYIKEIEGLKDGQTNGYYANIVDYIYENSNVNIVWWKSVENWYSLYEINYLVLIVGGIFMLYALGSISFAMIKRIFFLLILFIISPGVCALYPLDEGKTVQSWSGEVKKQVLSAYGAVAGLNLFFALVPLIDKISIFSDPTYMGWGVSDIIQIFIFVTGLLVVKDIIALISGFVGGDNAYSTGAGLMKSASKEVAGRFGKATLNTVGAFRKAYGAAKQTGKAKDFWGSLGKSVGFGALGVAGKAAKTLTGGAVDGESIVKTWKSSYAEGIKQGKKYDAGKFGEKKASDIANEYAYVKKEDGTKKLKTEGLQTSVLTRGMSDAVTKVVFESQIKKSDQAKTLGIKGKKQDEAMADIRVADNVVTLVERINKAIASGDNSRIEAAYKNFNEYFEHHSDEISGNEQILEAVETVQAQIARQRDSGTHTAIDVTDTTVIGSLKSASHELAKTIAEYVTNETGEVRKAAAANEKKEPSDKK